MRLKIRYKITLIITVILVIILAGIFMNLNARLKENAFNRIRTNLAHNIYLAKAYLESDLFNGITMNQVDDIADRIGRYFNLRATIIGRDGVVLGDSELEGQGLYMVENHLYRPEVQQALKSGLGESRRFSTTLRKDFLYMATVYSKGNNKGFIRLAIPLSEIDDIAQRLKDLLINAFMIAFILSIIFGFLASIYISNPIKKLSSFARQIARGDFSGRVNITTKDEVQDLANSINYMSEQIRFRIEDVISNKSRLETVLLSMFDGLIVLDKMGNMILINETLKKIFNINVDPYGKKTLEIIRNIEVQNIADEVLNLKEGVISKEISVLLPEEKIFQVHATPICRERRIDGAVLVFHDISELRRLEKIRKDFVANVSHELRTPVSTIKGYAETLLDGAIDDKDNAKDFLQIIHSDADRLANLINDLLDLSKIESGKLDLIMDSFDVGDIVGKIFSELKPLAKRNKVELLKDIPSEIPKVRVDEKGISQVLYNLVDNAIKYNKEDGSVTVTAEKTDAMVKINVIDTGIGIPQEDLPRIFERFYRVDKAHSRQLGGTGLGLSIVKHIVQAHKGEVSVESRLGEGSTFSFTLPQA